MVSDKHYPYLALEEHHHIYKYMNQFIGGTVPYDDDLVRAALHQAPHLAVHFLIKYPMRGYIRDIAVTTICNCITAAGDFWYHEMYVDEVERHKAFKGYIQTEGAALSVVKHNVFNNLDHWEKDYLVNKVVEWKHAEYARSMLEQQGYWHLTEEQRNKLAPLGVAEKLMKTK